MLALPSRSPVTRLRLNGFISCRKYHDESFGFRRPREFVLPDCQCPLPLPLDILTSTANLTFCCPSDSEVQLKNRAENAPLLRYSDSLRTHGHRAARIDPLDLLQREEVAALSPARYGLVDGAKQYNVNGILWAKPVGEDADTEDWWSLRDIEAHLRAVYVGRIAYEYMNSPSKTERMWFAHMLESQGAAARAADDAQKKRIHELLARSETFDQFLQLKFPNLKRYGLEGGESMITALDTLFLVAAKGASLN